MLSPHHTCAAKLLIPGTTMPPPLHADALGVGRVGVLGTAPTSCGVRGHTPHPLNWQAGPNTRYYHAPPRAAHSLAHFGAAHAGHATVGFHMGGLLQEQDEHLRRGPIIARCTTWSCMRRRLAAARARMVAHQLGELGARVSGAPQYVCVAHSCPHTACVRALRGGGMWCVAHRHVAGWGCIVWCACLPHYMSPCETTDAA